MIWIAVASAFVFSVILFYSMSESQSKRSKSGAAAKSKAEAAPGEYLMDHTSIIYLMAPDGRYLTHFTHGMSAEAMVARIRDNLD